MPHDKAQSREMPRSGIDFEDRTRPAREDEAAGQECCALLRPPQSCALLRPPAIAAQVSSKSRRRAAA